MPSRCCRFAAVLLPLVTPVAVLGAQGPSRLDAGASAGGSAFGWQPRLGVGGALPAASLGPARLTMEGSFARIDGSTTPRSELLAGARLSTPDPNSGWWIGADVVRRVGLTDLVEQPRVSSGGWRRIGPFTVGVAASRRTARLSDIKRFDRNVITYFSYLDSLTGRWDSTARITTVADSARTSERRLWMETQGTLSWESGRFAAELTAGGRFASRSVPAGMWGGAEVAVRLARPLSLVLGGGTASSSSFALDAEHRYLTLGFRVRPPFPAAEPAPAATATPNALGPLGIDDLSAGRYRLSLWAPRAHSVEITGDFTGWKPLTLTRGEGGEWSLSLVIMPGAHQMNARIDGGAWIVPPGMTTMTDDFAGEVGILMIDGAGIRR